MTLFLGCAATPLTSSVLAAIAAVLFPCTVILWLVADLQRPTDYRVTPYVEHNDLGEIRTRYKIQQLKWFGWQNYTAWYSGCDVEYIPVFESQDKAEAKILDLKQRFYR